MQSFIIGLLFVFSSQAFGQGRDFSKVEIKTIKLTESLYMLQGAGGNIGVSQGADGIFIIDDQYAPLSAKIKAALKKINSSPVKFVLNTHWHGDHTGGNENFGKAGAVIVAHENVREKMSKAQFIKIFGMKTPAAPRVALPMVTFTDRITFHLNGDDIEVFHVKNAHTDGDGIVHFKKANVIHTGDTFFNGFYPFIDGSSGGSIKGMIRAVQKVLKIANSKTKIMPGHGPLADKKDLERFLKMLTGTGDAIAKLKRSGKSLQQVIDLKPTAKFDDSWGKGFLKPEKFVEVAYSAVK